MKATIKFNLTIEVDIETEKDIIGTTVMDLELKSSNLGSSLIDTLKNMKTHELLNNKINSDYKATIISVSSKEPRQITIK